MNRRGFTLFELVSVLAALSAALTIGVLIFATMMKANRLARNLGETVTAHATLTEKLRNDAHQAVGILAHCRQYDAGPRCIILELSDERHVVYDFRDGVLHRDDFRTKQRVALPPRKVPEFSTREAMIVLRLVDSDHSNPRPAVEILAALGGCR